MRSSWQRTSAGCSSDCQDVWIARAEAAGLRVDAEGHPRRGAPGDESALHASPRMVRADFACWRFRAGLFDVPPVEAAPPFPPHSPSSGHWAAAAAQWRALGCPYEEARALADGDEAALHAALATFKRLGAQPWAERVVKRLRRWVCTDPRVGHATPRAPRQGHSPGVRARSSTCSPRGLTNAQIGERLVLSERTVPRATLARSFPFSNVREGEAEAGVVRASMLKKKEHRPPPLQI